MMPSEHDRQLDHDRYEALVEQSSTTTMLLDITRHALRVNRAWLGLREVPDDAASLQRLLARYRLLEDAQLIAESVLPKLRHALAGMAVAFGPLHYDPAEME